MHSKLKLVLMVLCAAFSFPACFTIAAADTPLVNPGDSWRLRSNTTAPPANWQTLSDASLDASWQTAPGGFGYGDPTILNEATALNTMSNTFRSLCIRKTINIPSALGTNLILNLIVDYDDGMAAWLDGVLVASNNTPAGFTFNGSAPVTREASCCGTGTNPPQTNALGQASLFLPPGNHVLAIEGWNQSITSSDFHLIPWLQLATTPTNDPGCVSGSIGSDATWYATNSPITVCGTVTVASGVTLVIEPGVTVLFNPGQGMTVNGRLLAIGDATNRIIFTRSGASGTWSHLLFNANSATSQIVHAEMRYFASPAVEGHNTALQLDSIVWTNSTVAAVDLHTCSIVLLNSFIPGGAGNEPVHFSGMPANGHALIKGCVFGPPQGYNDSIDFTGGNRPGPIAQFIDNVFLAAVDDCFDMDATDAHIEGNIFMNVKQDAQRDSSSNPITTGEGPAVSELVITRNIFYNCEHTLLLKDSGASVMQNNTIVHLTTNALSRNAAGNPIPPGIILFGEPWRGRPPGGGAVYEGNIAYDLDPAIQANPFPLYSPTGSFFVVSQSLTQGTNWPGAGNLSGDPLFANLAGPMTAANIRSNLALLAGSPCLGTGPNGIDMGAVVPAGASISGAPASPTTNTTATLKIAGPGIWSYRWRLDGAAWSSEVSLVPASIWNGQPFMIGMLSNAPPITLSNLANGQHTVEVIGRNSAGFWQDTNAAASVTWTVQTTPTPQLLSASRVGNTASITFIAVAGQTYSVFFRDAFDGAHPWSKLGDVPAQGATGPFTYFDPTLSLPNTRFYRIVTPAQ